MTRRAPLRAPWLALALALAGCGAQERAGNGDGAPRGALSLEAEGLVGVAETAPLAAVLVSDRILSYDDKAPMLRGIVDVGAELWVLVRDDEYRARVLEALDGSPERVRWIDAPTDSVWVRDYGPLPVSVAASGQRAWLDHLYHDDRPLDDQVPAAVAAAVGGPEMVLGLANEGGNFLCGGERCHLTERVVDANLAEDEEGEEAETRVRREVVSRYDEAFVTKIVAPFPRMPDEPTGHIDMWAVFVGERTVLVGEILEETLALAPEGSELAADVRRYLDERARDLEALGYDVERIPMPLPYGDLFRSYTNALLVQVGDQKRAFLPRYEVPLEAPKGSKPRKAGSKKRRKPRERKIYPDVRLVARYEAAVKAAYERHGYEIQWVPSDDVIDDGGAVHCITMHVPAP